jgi:translation initiation factor SUI1
MIPAGWKSAQKPIISTSQRTARKKLTIVNGIPDDIDLDLVLRAWKKIFHCVGSVKYDPKIKENYIELNGDHRQEVYEFLIHEGIGSEEYIKMHGADN